MKTKSVLSFFLILWIMVLTACHHTSDSPNEMSTAEETSAPKAVEVAGDADPVELASRILASPGTVYVLGVGSGEVDAALDVNLDGVSEKILVKDRDSTGYDFSVGEIAIELTYLGSPDDTYEWELVAVSPDGENILVGVNTGIAETGSSSADLFLYDGTGLTNVFSAYIDILDEHTWIDAGEITAIKRTGAPLVNRVHFRWTADENGEYQAAYDDVYDLLDENTVELYKRIILYKAPDGSSEAEEIAPQKISFLKTDMGAEKNKNSMSSFLLGGAQSWMYLRAEDGSEGWVQVGDIIQTADGELLSWVEVFGILD